MLTVTVRTETYSVPYIQITSTEPVQIGGGKLVLLFAFLPQKGVDLRLPFISTAGGRNADGSGVGGTVMGSFGLLEAKFVDAVPACISADVQAASDTPPQQLDIIYRIDDRCAQATSPMGSGAGGSGGGSLSTGLIVGIAIVGVVVLALAVGLVYVSLRRRGASSSMSPSDTVLASNFGHDDPGPFCASLSLFDDPINC